MEARRSRYVEVLGYELAPAGKLNQMRQDGQVWNCIYHRGSRGEEVVEGGRIDCPDCLKAVLERGEDGKL